MKVQVGPCGQAAMDLFDVRLLTRFTRSTMPGRVRADQLEGCSVRIAAALLVQCQVSRRQDRHDLHQMVGETASRVYLCPEMLLQGYESGRRFLQGFGAT
jgi:hypothetical protein